MEPRPQPVDGRFDTRAVLGAMGIAPPEQAPLAPAIWPAAAWSTEEGAELGELLQDRQDGYVYGRYDNPTNTALHAAVATLHEAEAAWALASGTAAIHAVLSVLGAANGTILASTRLYGGTHALLERMRDRAGWKVEYVDVTDLDAVRSALHDDHALVYAETMANPTTALTDVGGLAEVCRDAGVPLAVDNTFASPWLTRPLALGATVVVESATKYLAGHGDVVGGVVAGTLGDVRLLRHHAYELGATLGPFEAWLVARGIQTLPLRMARSCDNAARIAAAVVEESDQVVVRHPSLEDHPQHALALRQFGGRGFGAVVCLEFPSREVAEAFADACRVLTRATSLGATRSLVLHPASTSHRQLSRQELAAAGVGEGTVRISAGIEDPADLVADVRRALSVAATHA